MTKRPHDAISEIDFTGLPVSSIVCKICDLVNNKYRDVEHFGLYITKKPVQKNINKKTHTVSSFKEKKVIVANFDDVDEIINELCNFLQKEYNNAQYITLKIKDNDVPYKQIKLTHRTFEDYIVRLIAFTKVSNNIEYDIVIDAIEKFINKYPKERDDVDFTIKYDDIKDKVKEYKDTVCKFWKDKYYVLFSTLIRDFFELMEIEYSMQKSLAFCSDCGIGCLNIYYPDNSHLIE